MKKVYIPIVAVLTGLCTVSSYIVLNAPVAEAPAPTDSAFTIVTKQEEQVVTTGTIRPVETKTEVAQETVIIEEKITMTFDDYINQYFVPLEKYGKLADMRRYFVISTIMNLKDTYPNKFTEENILDTFLKLRTVHENYTTAQQVVQEIETILQS